MRRRHDANSRTKRSGSTEQDSVSCQATSSIYVSWYDIMAGSHVLFMRRGRRTEKDEESLDTVDA
jgi:hypothetical protein